MRDSELVGLWSQDAIYGGSCPGGDNLIFKPDGNGRYEWINWGLCGTELFRWETPQLGVLCMFGERILQISADARSVLEQPSLFGTYELSYTIAEEDTPASGRIRVLRLPLEKPMCDFFGFERADLAGLEEPKFNLKR